MLLVISGAYLVKNEDIWKTKNLGHILESCGCPINSSADPVATIERE